MPTVEVELVDGFTLGDSIPASVGYKHDDFEWGSDGDPISNSGGGIVWSRSVPTGCHVEIDTAQAYSGTRSLGFYDYEPAHYPTATFSRMAISRSYSIGFRLRISATGVEFNFAHGNGTKFIHCYKTTNGTNYFAYSYTDSEGALKYSTVSSIVFANDKWHLLEIKNIDFEGKEYDVYFEGVFKARIPMRNGNAATNQIRLGGAKADNWCWYDDVEVIPANYISLPTAVDDSLTLSDALSPGMTLSPALTDGLELAEALSPGMVLPLALAEGVTLSDALSPAVSLSPLVEEALAVTDELSADVALSLVLADGLTMSEVLHALINLPPGLLARIRTRELPPGFHIREAE